MQQYYTLRCPLCDAEVRKPDLWKVESVRGNGELHIMCDGDHELTVGFHDKQGLYLFVVDTHKGPAGQYGDLRESLRPVRS